TGVRSVLHVAWSGDLGWPAQLALTGAVDVADLARRLARLRAPATEEQVRDRLKGITAKGVAQVQEYFHNVPTPTPPCPAPRPRRGRPPSSPAAATTSRGLVFTTSAAGQRISRRSPYGAASTASCSRARWWRRRTRTRPRRPRRRRAGGSRPIPISLRPATAC